MLLNWSCILQYYMLQKTTLFYIILLPAVLSRGDSSYFLSGTNKEGQERWFSNVHLWLMVFSVCSTWIVQYMNGKKKDGTIWHLIYCGEVQVQLSADVGACLPLDAFKRKQALSSHLFFGRHLAMLMPGLASRHAKKTRSPRHYLTVAPSLQAEFSLIGIGLKK